MPTDGVLIRADDVVVSAGSCFAANLIPYVEAAGFTYLRTEEPVFDFAYLPENLGYRDFSAAYGNIYSARQLVQLIERSQGLFKPIEDRWYADGMVVDPYRPGLRYPASSDVEFDLLTAQHLLAVRRAFERATVVVFTLGLTEAWESTLDEAVFPACPGTIAGAFDAERHRFRNFTAMEVREDLRCFIHRLRAVNPEVRLILTVSPVPLVATATDQHVLVATTYSKAALRVAAGDIAATETGVTYFPAFEIVAGPQADPDYYAADRRNVTKRGVDAVMRVFLAHCDPPRSGDATDANAAAPGDNGSIYAALAQEIATMECEEQALDPPQHDRGAHPDVPLRGGQGDSLADVDASPQAVVAAHGMGSDQDPAFAEQSVLGSAAAKRLRRWMIRVENLRWLFRTWLPIGWVNPLFDAEWYLATYPDVRRRRADPYRHYRRHGVAEGRNPNRLFNTAWYLDANPDVRARGLNPLDHYLSFGVDEGCNPSPFFDSQAYLAQNPDVRAAGMNPLLHYLRYGIAEGREKNVSG